LSRVFDELFYAIRPLKLSETKTIASSKNKSFALLHFTALKFAASLGTTSKLTLRQCHHTWPAASETFAASNLSHPILQAKQNSYHYLFFALLEQRLKMLQTLRNEEQKDRNCRELKVVVKWFVDPVSILIYDLRKCVSVVCGKCSKFANVQERFRKCIQV
jgi:hypothetical protein